MLLILRKDQIIRIVFKIRAKCDWVELVKVCSYIQIDFNVIVIVVYCHFNYTKSKSKFPKTNNTSIFKHIIFNLYHSL